jgi:hypothetical protein
LCTQLETQAAATARAQAQQYAQVRDLKPADASETATLKLHRKLLLHATLPQLLSSR